MMALNEQTKSGIKTTCLYLKMVDCSQIGNFKGVGRYFQSSVNDERRHDPKLNDLLTDQDIISELEIIKVTVTERKIFINVYKTYHQAFLTGDMTMLFPIEQ